MESLPAGNKGWILSPVCEIAGALPFLLPQDPQQSQRKHQILLAAWFSVLLKHQAESHRKNLTRSQYKARLLDT